LSIKEILTQMFFAFFIIFSAALLTVVITYSIFGEQSIRIVDIAKLLGIAAVTDLAHFILYSKKQLSKKQMLVRYILAGIYVLVVAMGGMTLIGWVHWTSPISVISIMTSVIIIYVLIVLIKFMHAKRAANKMNKKLRKLYLDETLLKEYSQLEKLEKKNEQSKESAVNVGNNDKK